LITCALVAGQVVVGLERLVVMGQAAVVLEGIGQDQTKQFR
jgi:hypothetical protein